MPRFRARRLLVPGLVLVAATLAAVFVASARSHEAPSAPRITQSAPAGYTSIEELLRETDVTVAATVVSGPRDYVDFGADGKPDYDGQSGMSLQLVTVRIDEVLRGDAALEGTELSVTQPSPLAQGSDGSLETDRISEGQRVVLVGRLDTANPGVGDEGESLLIPAGSGFGVFDLLADGSITPRVDGALGDTRFTAGVAIDPTLLAGDS